jgi:site-specific DNA-methyltransferase (adenine-specific)
MINSYNPDVLNTLANLSNDEVFTPVELANKILDMLPKTLWKNKNAKFLDPATKTGVFLREITKRLLKGLEEDFPVLQDRLDHILKNQVYGIAVTELTASLSARTLYCSKKANGKYSVTKIFKNETGNIIYEKINHSWNKGKCIYCQTSEKEYSRDSNKESYAYKFIHLSGAEEFSKMRFDVIIGNPPYQLADGGGTGDSAKPIYNLFFENAKKLNPKFIVFIMPSRWMKGGKGLDSFRAKNINDKRFKVIHDYENAKECFPGINLDGGVNYFLWESNYSGEVDYHFHSFDGNEFVTKRYLKEAFSDTVIRDPRQLSIIKKVNEKKFRKFSEIVSFRNPYGIGSDFFNRPENYGLKKVPEIKFNNSLLIYGIKGKKGGSKRVTGFLDKNLIKKNLNSINKYKLFFSKAYMTNSTIPPRIILGVPGSISTETFLEIGPFNSKEEQEQILDYIRTKFFRAILFFFRHSLNISKESFSQIPLLDKDFEYNDKKLYDLFDLDTKEIDYIESSIKEYNNSVDIEDYDDE